MRSVVHANGLSTWHFAFDGDDLLAAVTTRNGGVSTGPYAELNLGFHVGDQPERVAENRRRLCEALGVGTLTVCDQQHRDRVAIVDSALAGAGHNSAGDATARLGATDALVTGLPGVALTVMVADCAPVVLYDPEHRAVGVAHVGRGGAVRDVLGVAIRTMSTEFGSVPAQLHAGVGPCINSGAYEIDGTALEETRAVFAPALFRPTRDGAAAFDLRSAVLERLVEHGIRHARLEVDARTTTDSRDELFSDRAERPCGRFMLVAALRPR
jgi:YfiH family protein